MYFCVDIGGTNIRVAASKDRKRIVAIRKFPNPGSWREALRQVAATARTLSEGRKIRGVAVGVPGVINRTKGFVVRAPHLKSWNGKPLVRTLSKLLKCPVVLENDTVLGALGEANFGAGKGYRITAYLAPGTGLGGARVESGVVSVRAHGFEPGHQILDPKGPLWPYCGQRGCFESYSSGTAFMKTYGMRMGDCRDRRIWKAYASRFAQGLVNVIVLWSPNIVVIGGGPGIAAAPRLLPILRAETKKRLKMVQMPPVAVAELGDDSGLYGGLMLLR